MSLKEVYLDLLDHRSLQEDQPRLVQAQGVRVDQRRRLDPGGEVALRVDRLFGRNF